MAPKDLFRIFREGIGGKNAGYTGAVAGAVLGLLWVIFGFLKMVFIVVLALVGYYIGAKYFSQPESIQRLLDKLFPPGRFR